MTNAGSSARLRWGSLVKQLSVSPTGITPGRKHRLVCALFVLSMITYVDRTSVSIAKEPISTQLNLSDRQMGMVFSSFALGYSIMQIPAGGLADKVGPRAVLSGAVAFWSVLTALTGAAWSFYLSFDFCSAPEKPPFFLGVRGLSTTGCSQANEVERMALCLQAHAWALLSLTR
jgi:MFS family permease